MHKEEKYLRDLLNGVVYDEDLFKIFIGGDKLVLGGIYLDGEDNEYFIYKTLYDTIVDIDKKIKKSLDMALCWEYKNCDFKVSLVPSDEEKEAIYYTENAVFRTMILWDLLAQLYNVRFNENRNPDKVYCETLFHNGTQGKRPNAIAQQVYSYLIENEQEDYIYEENEFWKGNHKYVKEYRDKMTHRNSPNVMFQL